MSEEKIREIFEKVVHDKDAMKRIGATKYQVYNWRNPERYTPTLGIMLEVLWKLDLLKLSK